MASVRGSRFFGLLLARASLLAAPIARAQSWSSTGGEFQRATRGLLFHSLRNTTIVCDPWAAVHRGGLFKHAPRNSTRVPINTLIETTKRATLEVKQQQY